MSIRRVSLGLVAAGLYAANPARVNAGINTELWGTAPPSISVGGYALAAFPVDGRGLGTDVTTFAPPVASPVSGNVVSDVPLQHSIVGGGWGSWGHGYDGDVYWLDEDTYGAYDPASGHYSSTLNLTLPTDTKAFALYLEPNFLGTFDFVVSSGGTSQTLVVDGNGGSQGIAFYTDDPNASLLSLQIQRDGDFSDGYAIGEFSINSLGPVGAPEGAISPAFLAAVICGLFIIHKGAESRATIKPIAS